MENSLREKITEKLWAMGANKEGIEGIFRGIDSCGVKKGGLRYIDEQLKIVDKIIDLYDKRKLERFLKKESYMKGKIDTADFSYRSNAALDELEGILSAIYMKHSIKKFKKLNRLVHFYDRYRDVAHIEFNNNLKKK